MWLTHTRSSNQKKDITEDLFWTGLAATPVRPFFHSLISAHPGLRHQLKAHFIYLQGSEAYVQGHLNTVESCLFQRTQFFENSF